MGLKLSKQLPGNSNSRHRLTVQYQVINYLSKNFFLRNLVSKKRRRMLVGGYDLDMSYITSRILAMSFPAERMRAMFRNPMWQVKTALEMRHHGHYKVYNLCVEQDYDPSHFHGRVEKYPFDDNHVPPLEMVKEFCDSVHSWLSSNPKNIAVIHCMAGKGRTGLMVSCYLVYTGLLAEDALQIYADKRTTNNQGVSLPSQRRYVHYWEKSLSFPKAFPPLVSLPNPGSRELRRIRLYDTNNIGSIFFVVSELQEVPGQRYRPSSEIYRNFCRKVNHGSIHRTSSPRYFYSFIEKNEEEGQISEQEGPRVVVQMDTESSTLYQKTCLDHYFDKPLHVNGDVRVIFYEKKIGGRLFYACFNTAFIENSLLQFSILELDKVAKRGRSIAGPEFCVELFFGPANPDYSFLAPPYDDDLVDGPGING